MNTKLTPNLPLDASPTDTPSPKRSRPPAPRTVDFNLPEAVRLAALGYGYRKIARALGNCSHETVRTKLREYEARIEAAKPKPPEPIQSSPLPVPVPETVKPPAVPPAASSQQVRPPIPPIPPVTPSSPPPEPISNYDGLAAYWAARGKKDFKPDTRCFFLVHGAHNVEYGTGSEQFMVGIDQWHREYYDLEVFQHAERVWVVLVPSEDNRVFLLSLVNDIRVRENCMVVRSDVFRICQDRYGWLRNHRGDFMSAIYDAEFEKVYGFQPMPQPNHVREIEELLRPPKPPDVPSSLGGAFGGTPPQASFNEVPQKGDKSCGFAF